KGIHEPHKITFLSDADASVQYFMLIYPLDYDPKKQYSLRIYLHGGGDIAAETMYIISPKDWAFILAPTNRRPMGWEWWDFARFNIYESMELVIDKFPIDPNRIYLTGASNGGQGTWYNGLRDPSRFAALAPNCAWSSYSHHAPRFWDPGDMFAPPELLHYRDRMMYEFNNPAFVSNAGNIPVIASQGAEDPVVSPMNQRLFLKISAMHNNEIVYREIPGKPHAWTEPLTADGGGDFFDHPEINDFLRGKERDQYPLEVRIRLCDLSVNDTFYWVCITEQYKKFSETILEARIMGTKVRIESSNVKCFTVELNSALIPGDTATIEWNRSVMPVRLDQCRTITMGESCQHQDGRLQGPLKAAFYRPYLLVIGTAGNRHDNEIMLHNARTVAQRSWRIANGYTRIVQDRDISDDLVRNCNLILFGAPERNSFTALAADSLPFQISDQAMTVGERRLEGDISLEMVYPNPLNTERLLALFAGTSAAAETLCTYFDPLHPGEPVPDFIIYSEDVKKYHWGGVQAAGFFSQNWDLDNNDYYIRPK
ncbi:MAG: hypothetical protein HN368_15825, partial [Spirochaetales bacterium]|nr:hypothetical protein [Spirochaetales bacterium]